jgi:hypothetical protein
MKAEMDKKEYRKAARTYIKELRAAQRDVDLEAMRDDENDMRDADRDAVRDAARDAVRDEDNPLFGRDSQRKRRVKEEDMDEYEQNLKPLVEGKIRQPSFGGGLGRRAMLSRWG